MKAKQSFEIYNLIRLEYLRKIWIFQALNYTIWIRISILVHGNWVLCNSKTSSRWFKVLHQMTYPENKNTRSLSIILPFPFSLRCFPKIASLVRKTFESELHPCCLRKKCFCQAFLLFRLKCNMGWLDRYSGFLNSPWRK